jgi:predicted permease
MNTLIILQQMLMIAILVAIGFFLFRKGIIEEQATHTLSVIVTDVCNPALVLSCVLQGNIHATWQDVCKGMGIAAVIYTLMCFIGIALPKILHIPKKEQKFYQLMTVYTNTGFIGIPLAKAVLGNTEMLYVIIFNVMFCLFFYTHGVLVAAEGKEHLKLKNFFNPGTIMSVCTIVVFCFNITFPSVISGSIIYIGNTTTFLSMCLLGGSLAKASFGEIIREVKLYPYVLIRMLLIPLLAAWIMKNLHVSHEMILAFTLMLAMPAANLPLIQAEKIGEDTSVLSHGIVMTTVLSLVTITIVMALVR